ncbi:MAG: universal stress protein [Geminicoccaceae bacterium]
MSDLYIVGIDGSEASRRALFAAARAAKRASGRLLLAHVIAETPGTDLAPVAPETVFGQQEQELETARSHLLEPLAAEARDLGVPVELKTLRGDPATLLAELAAFRGAVQLFVGRTGHSRLHERLFGSTLAALARKTTVPVTLVP